MDQKIWSLIMATKIKKLAIKKFRSPSLVTWKLDIQSPILYWSNLFSFAIHNGGNLDVMIFFLMLVLIDATNVQWMSTWCPTQNGDVTSILITLDIGLLQLILIAFYHWFEQVIIIIDSKYILSYHVICVEHV